MGLIRSKKRAGKRIAIFGPSGAGKTTCAADWNPDAAFISGQEGLPALDVQRWSFDEKTGRMYAQNYEEVLAALRGVIGADVPAVVVDEFGAVEQLCGAYVCKANNWKNIGQPGYGKGEAALFSEFRVLQRALEDVWNSGKDLLFTLHAKQGKIPNPGSAEEPKRWEPALTAASNADVCGAFVGWLDACLFLEPEIDVLKVESGLKKKAIGSVSGRRIMFTQQGTGYMAKCRYRNVPDSLYIPAINPMAELKALIAEGESVDAMRRKVERMAAAAGAGARDRVLTALAGPKGGDLVLLNNMAQWLASQTVGDESGGPEAAPAAAEAAAA